MFNKTKITIIVLALACSVLAISTLSFWWRSHTAPKPVPELPAAEERIAPNKVIAEKAVVATLPVAAPKKRTVRQTTAVITPDKPGDVAVDVSIVKDDSGTRAVVTTDNGTVTQAKDLVIDPALFAEPERKNRIYAAYTSANTVEVGYDRKLSKHVFVGVAIEHDHYRNNTTYKARVGVEF